MYLPVSSVLILAKTDIRVGFMPKEQSYYNYSNATCKESNLSSSFAL